MPVNSIAIKNFRNLPEANLSFNSQFNIIYGENGAGKTSILEAIYYLLMGRSFRTALTNRVIQNGKTAFTVFLEFEDSFGNKIPIGTERAIDGTKTLRMAGDKVHSIAAIAKCVPLLFMSTKSYLYFSNGPKLRRQYLDWGAFHANASYNSTWLSYHNAVKQRNAALKKRSSNAEIQAWDHMIVTHGNLIDLTRNHYQEQVTAVFSKLIQTLLPESPNIAFQYSRGWAQDFDLRDALQKNLQKDLACGYTSAGPHRADFQLFIDKTPVDDVLSQGQQKLAAYALYLSQGILMHQTEGKGPAYLIDDLPSELDSEKRQLITNILKEIKAQVFVTGITLEDLSPLLDTKTSSTFYVKHGQVIHET